MGLLNNAMDHPFDGLILLVEEAQEHFRVAINAKRQLGQVVGADREAVEPLSESRSQNDVRGDFAHYIDLKSLLAALKTILRHNLQHAVGLVGRAAEGDHYHDVGEA